MHNCRRNMLEHGRDGRCSTTKPQAAVCLLGIASHQQYGGGALYVDRPSCRCHRRRCTIKSTDSNDDPSSVECVSNTDAADIDSGIQCVASGPGVYSINKCKQMLGSGASSTFGTATLACVQDTAATAYGAGGYPWCCGS